MVLAYLIQLFTANKPAEYWLILHSVILGGFLILLNTLFQSDFILKLVLTLYFVLFVGVNLLNYIQIRLQLTEDFVKSHISVTTRMKYTVYYNESAKTVIIIPSLWSYLLKYPDIQAYSTSLTMYPLYFTWIQHGKVLQLSEQNFYQTLKRLDKIQESLVEVENSVAKELMENEDSEAFERLIREQIVIDKL